MRIKLVFLTLLTFSFALPQNATFADEQSSNASPIPTTKASAAPQKIGAQKLSFQQKSQIASAQAAYYATAQQALDGANRAIADAKSLLSQALSAAGKDKTLRAMAIADYKKNTETIWAAFKQDIANAKGKLAAAIDAIKSSTNK